MEETVEKLIQEFETSQAMQTARNLSENKKAPNLGWLASLCTGIVFVALKSAAGNINNPLNHRIAMFFIRNAETLTTLLTDADKDNIKQITAHYKNSWQVLCTELLEIAGELAQRELPDGMVKESFLSTIKNGLSVLVN